MKNINGLKSHTFHIDNIDIKKSSKDELSPLSTAPVRRSDDSETAARQYLQLAIESPSVPGLVAPNINGKRSEFKSLGTETISFTNSKTVKFRQTFNKVPIYGSLVTVELKMNNELISINSSLGVPEHISNVASIDPAHALAIAKEKSGHGNEEFDNTPRVCFYYDAEKQVWRLIYLIEDIPVLIAEADEKQNFCRHGKDGEFYFHTPTLLMDFIIDAHTGEIVAELPRTPNISHETEAVDALGKIRKIRCDRDPVNNLFLIDEQYNVHTYNYDYQDLNPKILPGQHNIYPPDPWDRGAISAHANAVIVAQFLRYVLRRNGIDNMGSPILSSVNCIVESESTTGNVWTNAAWYNNQMVYGQKIVDGVLRSYAIGLDVVGHEIFHGITNYTARLQYQGESGALNESYSDIFGVIISNLDKPKMTEWNWEMGEELDGTGLPIRDMRDPKQYDQSDHMDRYRKMPISRFSDWGGVHFNSGIHNKAAYNIMTSMDAEGNPLFTIAEASILFYLTLTQHLSRTSLFVDSARGAQTVARSLFKNDPKSIAKMDAINAGFKAVGII